MTQIKRKHPLAECEKCPLAKEPCAPSQNLQSKVAVVSRSPGFHEARAGKPFSGPSGKVLDHLLGLNGLKREEVLVTNVVLCSSTDAVPSAAIKACSPRLQSELDNIDLVIAAGSEAVGELIGPGIIDRHRGYRHHRNGKVIIAANNPALVIRDSTTFPNLVRDFKLAFNPLPEPTVPSLFDEARSIEVVTTKREVKAVVELLKNDEYIGADIENHPRTGELITIQLSGDGNSAFVLDVGQTGLDTVGAFLAEPDRKFIWHNGKYDVRKLRLNGVAARVDEDTLLLSYALDERSGDEGEAKTHGVHGLKYLLTDRFGWPDYEYDSVKNFWRTGNMENFEEFCDYGGKDAAGTRQLFEQLRGEAVKDDVWERPYRYPLVRAVEVILSMEQAGFIYDINAAASLYEDEVLPKLEEYIANMRGAVDNPLLNPRSTKHMSALYYDRWHVKHAMTSRPNKKRSTDEAMRKEIIEDRFTIPEQFIPTSKLANKKKQAIKEFTENYDFYKKLDKQAGTYLIGLILRAENDPSQRIYTELLLHGTVTGRPSSRRPNLLNITRTKEGMPDIRGLFRASSGRKIVQTDYSQAELRSIAAFSGDSTLLSAYERGIDLHSLAAERFYGKDFTPEQRTNAKNMQFGVAFRQTAATFQEKHGIPEKEADAFIKWWWKEFATVAEWEKDVEQQIRKQGVLVSPFGRKRRFYLLTRENINEAYRQGINFYPQSTAADCTLTSCIRVYDNIDTKRAALVLTVYDSIIADVEEGYIDEYSKIVKQIMESAPRDEIGWTVPFEVDSGYGDTWAEAK